MVHFLSGGEVHQEHAYHSSDPPGLTPVLQDLTALAYSRLSLLSTQLRAPSPEGPSGVEHKQRLYVTGALWAQQALREQDTG